MLKVLIIASWYPSPESPFNGIFIKEQAEALAQVHDIAVIAPRTIGLRSVLRGYWNPRSSDECVNGVRVLMERQFVISRLPLAWQLSFAARRIRQMFHRLSAEWGCPDIIHAHVTDPGGYVAVQLKCQYGLPVVLTEHWTKTLEPLSAREEELFRHTLSQCDQVLAVGPAMAQWANALGLQRPVKISGNLIRTDFFTLGQQTPRGNKCCFLNVALLSKQKGIVYLLEAMAILHRKGIDQFEVLVGGDGNLRPWLEQRSRELGVDRYCRFLGSLNREEVRSQMQACDVFVHPSLTETFGIVVGEAMACGKPVITTRCGGPEFFVGPDVGIIVPPADPIALADAMERFIHGDVHFEPATIRESIVTRFGPAAFVDFTTRVYEEVLRNH